MKLLFVIVDGGGNVPPQLAVARALRARGTEIHILGHRRVRERAVAEGFHLNPLPTAETSTRPPRVHSPP